MSVFRVSGVHLPDTSPRARGVLSACWEGFASFPAFCSVPLRLKDPAGSRRLCKKMLKTACPAARSWRLKTLTILLRRLEDADRGPRQPRSHVSLDWRFSARGQRNASSASSCGIFCGNCHLAGSFAEKAVEIVRHAARWEAAVSPRSPLKGERRGNSPGYRSPFSRLPANSSSCALCLLLLLLLCILVSAGVVHLSTGNRTSMASSGA